MEKKQMSWFRTDKDIKFENSFKFWFALQWQNTFIQIFVVAFGILVFELCKLGACIDSIRENFSIGVPEGIFTTMGISLPLIVSSVVAYKGFWQFWNDIKHGRSR